MKAVVAAFNQEKALVGAFSVITNLWMEIFEALNLKVRDLALAELAHPGLVQTLASVKFYPSAQLLTHPLVRHAECLGGANILLIVV